MLKSSASTQKKLIIIGAGPIGCYTAQLLKHYGFEPLVLEEHPEVGKPVACAGIVGRNVFEDMILPVSKKSILNKIDGAKISFLDSAFLLKRDGVAYIIDRERFDKDLGQGLKIEFNTRFMDAIPNGPGFTIKTSNGEYYADMVIGADGPNSRVRKAFEMPSSMKLYKGLQYRIKSEVADSDRVEVSYEKPFSLFTWMIPEGNGIARVGTISEKPLFEIEEFLKKRGLENKEIIEKNAGPIPIGTCQFVKNNQAALVGDAACQIKPITSGGIYYGMKAAELLAMAIKNIDLQSYQARWDEEFGKEINLCLLARHMMESMSDDVLMKIFNYVKENASLIEKVGDFENHSSIFWTLITNPRTYPTIGAVALEVLKRPKILMKLFKKK